MTYVLCTYSFIFMLWAGSLWFDVFLLQILLLPFVVVGVIFSICLAVKNIRHKKSLQERIISLIPFVIAILCMAMLFLPTDWKVYVDHCLFQTQRLNAIEKILREHLSEEQVDLPHRWLSCNGKAWIFDQEKKLVGFPVKSGLLSPSWVVVYSEQGRPPTEKELHSEVIGYETLSPHWYYMHIR